ncbi:MAG: hypothetical protein LBS86_07575, partial [Treponema sp.]|nr:hypothetical protein [Treponema sp.]
QVVLRRSTRCTTAIVQNEEESAPYPAGSEPCGAGAALIPRFFRALPSRLHCSFLLPPCLADG